MLIDFKRIHQVLEPGAASVLLFFVPMIQRYRGSFPPAWGSRGSEGCQQPRPLGTLRRGHDVGQIHSNAAGKA